VNGLPRAGEMSQAREALEVGLNLNRKGLVQVRL